MRKFLKLVGGIRMCIFNFISGKKRLHAVRKFRKSILDTAHTPFEMMLQ
jgi:hypothetical protein